MIIDDIEITYNVDTLYDITLSVFNDELKDINISLLKNEPTLFSFYEDNISYPLDEKKDNVSIEREDFYEMISIMSWAIYREWVKYITSNNIAVNDLRKISKDKVVELFLDNLNCEEAMDLYKKVMSS